VFHALCVGLRGDALLFAFNDAAQNDERKSLLEFRPQVFREAKSGDVCRVAVEILDFAVVAASVAACPVKVRPVFRGAVGSVSLGARCW